MITAPNSSRIIRSATFKRNFHLRNQAKFSHQHGQSRLDLNKTSRKAFLCIFGVSMIGFGLNYDPEFFTKFRQQSIENENESKAAYAERKKELELRMKHSKTYQIERGHEMLSWLNLCNTLPIEFEDQPASRPSDLQPYTDGDAAARICLKSLMDPELIKDSRYLGENTFVEHSKSWFKYFKNQINLRFIQNGSNNNYYFNLLFNINNYTNTSNNNNNNTKIELMKFIQNKEIIETYPKLITTANSNNTQEKVSFDSIPVYVLNKEQLSDSGTLATIYSAQKERYKDATILPFKIPTRSSPVQETIQEYSSLFGICSQFFYKKATTASGAGGSDNLSHPFKDPFGRFLEYFEDLLHYHGQRCEVNSKIYRALKFMIPLQEFEKRDPAPHSNLQLLLILKNSDDFKQEQLKGICRVVKSVQDYELAQVFLVSDEKFEINWKTFEASLNDHHDDGDQKLSDHFKNSFVFYKF